MNKHGLYLIALGFSLTDHGVLHQSFWKDTHCGERTLAKKGRFQRKVCLTIINAKNSTVGGRGQNCGFLGVVTASVESMLL